MRVLFLDSGMAEPFHIIQRHPPDSSMEQRKVYTPSDGQKHSLWWIQNKFKGEHGSTAKGKMVEVVGGNWLDQAPTSLATMAFNTTQCEPRKSLVGVKGASTNMPEFRRLEVLMFGQQMVSSPRARA